MNKDKCSIDGCDLLTHAKDLCRRHYMRLRLYGRLHKIRGIDKGICKVDDCNKPADSLGLCTTHYQRQHLHGRLYKVNGDKRKHPFYMMWHERKRNKLLCETWLNFNNFIQDISPKPEGNYFLIRLQDSGPYGPDNFKWQEHLSRNEIETDQEWWARKWARRSTVNPNFTRTRHLERNFGITNEDYNHKLWLQNGKCAICKNEESALYKGRVKKLAVDHNHATGKIRDLLCWRCNGVIGKFGEDLELLNRIRDYLIKHKQEK